MSLLPLTFTPREAAAVAGALSRSEHVLFTKDAHSALQNIMAARSERALDKARNTAEKVRLLVQPVPGPDADHRVTTSTRGRDRRRGPRRTGTHPGSACQPPRIRRG
jgi:hypothetical protein